MSTATVKKRGRPKKVVSSEEDATVVEYASKPKPRKSTPKAQIVKDTKEPSKDLSEPTQTAKDVHAVRPLVKRGANARNVAATKPANNEAAKHKAPLTAGSAILQKANAFTTVTQPTPSADREVPGLDAPGQTSVQGPSEVGESESNWKAQKPSIAIKEQELQQGAASEIFGAGVQDVDKGSQLTTSAQSPVEEAPAPVLQHSGHEPAVPMSNGSPSSLASSQRAQSMDKIKNTTSTSLPLKAEPPSTGLPKLSPQPQPRLPSSFAPAPAPAPPPRPTQLPYHELKKNPEFKALSRRYTSLIVAIPIVLVTSYVLFNRCELRQSFPGP